MPNLEQRPSERNDIAVLESLVRDWVDIGWRHSADEPFDFRERLGDFYDWTSSLCDFTQELT